jgi:succinate-semialdehyde dehydrogenase/glutarate-semialdehyde dehydrogenase
MVGVLRRFWTRRGTASTRKWRLRHGNGCEDAAELRRRRLGRGDGRPGPRDRLSRDGREARRRAERERRGRQAAAKAARAAQPKWAALSAWDRAKVCHAIADLIEERKEDFARELSLEQGKPYAAEAIPDIEETAENFRIAAEDVKRMETAVIPSQDVNKRILTFRRPNGVYAGITPWNFPTLIPVELIAPGIAAGNAIVMKPSEWTPIAMANFMQIMADAGLPDGVVNVVYGDGKVGERLIQDENVDCVGFVGSHTTAEKIVRAAGLKRSLIEASGNGPVVVCVDADLEAAAKGAVFGGFFCAGQVCCATSACSWTSACTTTSSPRSSRRPRAGSSAIPSTTTRLSGR